jgi:hypothetical protein
VTLSTEYWSEAIERVSSRSAVSRAAVYSPRRLGARRAASNPVQDRQGKALSPTAKRFEFRGSDPKRSTMLKWKRALDQIGDQRDALRHRAESTQQLPELPMAASSAVRLTVPGASWS